MDPATVDPQPGVCGGRQLFIVIGNHIRDSPALAVKAHGLVDQDAKDSYVSSTLNGLEEALAAGINKYDTVEQ